MKPTMSPQAQAAQTISRNMKLISHNELAGFGGIGTLVRDPQAVSAQALGLDTFPATVIVTADGDVADVLVGERPRIAEDVAETLAAVVRGLPTAGLVRTRHRRRIEEYRRVLDRAAGGAAERMPEQVIAPRRQPVRFKLIPAWQGSVSLPGNILCLDSTRGAVEPRIVALDGWRTVVEFDAAGSERGRHELDLPADAGVAFLRTAVAADGTRWWLGGRRGGRQVFVFDDAWRTHGRHPAAAGEGQVAGADLGDLDGDGVPEIVVAFDGAEGVEVTTLAGEVRWHDRSVTRATDVAIGAPVADGKRPVLTIDHGRLVTAGAGRGPGDAAGAAIDLRLTAVVAGPVAADAAWALLGIARPDPRRQIAMGIAPATESVEWRLPLSGGVFRDGPIEPVAWADLLGTPRRQWLITSPDGSVTVTWADGGVVDRYQHGRALLGVGGYRHQGRGHLVVVSSRGLEAFVVDDVALD